MLAVVVVERCCFLINIIVGSNVPRPGRVALRIFFPNLTSGGSVAWCNGCLLLLYGPSCKFRKVGVRNFVRRAFVDYCCRGPAVIAAILDYCCVAFGPRPTMRESAITRVYRLLLDPSFGYFFYRPADCYRLMESVCFSRVRRLLLLPSGWHWRVSRLLLVCSQASCYNAGICYHSRLSITAGPVFRLLASSRLAPARSAIEFYYNFN